jgi:hypothetical protein
VRAIVELWRMAGRTDEVSVLLRRIEALGRCHVGTALHPRQFRQKPALN